MKRIWGISIFFIVMVLGYFGYRSLTDRPPLPNKSSEAVSNISSQPAINADHNTIVRDGEISIPQKYQLTQATVSGNFQTDQDLRNSFSGSDRLIMDDFYGKFDQNAIAFTKPEQYDWLVRNGYPMPQDVIAAQKMNIDELGNLVDQGNIKASYFYLMREVYGKNGENVLDKINKTGFDSQWSQRLVNAEKLVRSSGSPFAGYIVAARAAKEGNNAEGVYAGYALASVMGDTRALNALAHAENVNTQSLVSALSVQMDMMRLANPNVFAGKPTEFPDRYSVGIRY
ncbi:hypothetical protein [Burkholderia cepacia]|uniref:Uncharacterized protein n=1 Tax=Burkholderia cepacia TaxID=292 RepID=A0ABM6NSH7_BURCE|nr:hypothetical protein [Burkholderia cepacia]AIO23733.1 hypothetical protein DM41_1437 [Burkholderia cepacia ATCC 25416]ASE94216.1 hypothetical protein CEQ23_11665 [Burkholderia cepacia]ATF77609.1 hypothetical protein CO711_09325 [Burkholderia cepacia]MCA7941557.1 hypothetical protein [Burkholderia cepacia]MCA8058772.1 hypothetical protein [Burkholderia cepacia]